MWLKNLFAAKQEEVKVEIELGELLIEEPYFGELPESIYKAYRKMYKITPDTFKNKIMLKMYRHYCKIGNSILYELNTSKYLDLYGKELKNLGVYDLEKFKIEDEVIEVWKMRSQIKKIQMRMYQK